MTTLHPPSSYLADDEDELVSYIPEELTAEDWLRVPEVVDVVWALADLLAKRSSGIALYSYQEEFGRRVIESVVTNDGDELTALFARQMGKALDVATPILTETGWSTMGTVGRGERVYGPDGRLTSVVDTSEVFTDHACYRLRFSDGQEIVADADHRWTLRDQYSGAMTTVTTAFLAGQELRYDNGKPERPGYRYKLEVAQALERPEVELPVDPYVLGLWLGDGSSYKAELTTADWDCAQAFLDAGYEISYAYTGQGRAISYGFLGLYTNLRFLGLIKLPAGRTDSGSKHVPEIYSLAGEKQRLALMQGLMDSDGHCDALGNVEFSSTRLVLATDVLFLARSLGWKATLTEERAMLYGKDCGPKYRVRWHPYADANPFRLERKACLVRQSSPVEWRRRRTASVALRRVEPVASVKTRCIAVDNESHLYLAGRGLIPTHNTEVVSDVLAAMMVLLPILAGLSPYRKLLKKFAAGLLVGTFAPVGDQADTLFDRIKDRLTGEKIAAILSDPEIAEEAVPGSNVVQLRRNRSLCRMSTAHPKAKIESKTYHILVMDEAQGADERMWSKCLAAGTPIWLPDGRILPVEEVVAQQLPVLSYDSVWDIPVGSEKLNHTRDRSIGKLQPTIPTEWHTNGVQPVTRVTLASGRQLTVTPEHRWVTRSRAGNRSPIWRTTAELLVGMGVPQPRGVDFWGSDGTEADGYFVGAMLGDGCTTGGSPMWCGHLDGSTAQMRAYVEAKGCSAHLNHAQEFGLHEYSFTRPQLPGQPRTVPNPLTVWLREQGLWGLKGANKKLARMDYSRDFFRGFIAGLLDTDGCASGKTISFSTISEDLMRQLQDALTKLGIYSFLQTRANNGRFTENPAPLWTVTVKGGLDVLRFIETIRSRNKWPALRQVGERAKQSKWSHRVSTDPYRGYDESICWDRITKIEPAGESETYCVTVEPSHLWVVNGTVTGQSISPMGSATNATKIMLGTPDITRGVFYKTIKRNQRDATRRGGRINHYQFDWKVGAKHNPNYAKYVAKEQTRLGPDSDEFRLAYRLEWLLERGMFTTTGRMEDLGDRGMQRVKHWGQPVLIGVDPARKIDSTVVTAVWVDWDKPNENGMFHHRVLDWLEMEGEDWENQYFRIATFVSNYPGTVAVGVDGGGMGDAVADRLVHLLPPSIQVIALSSSPQAQHERWRYLTELMTGTHPYYGNLFAYPAHASARRTKTWRRFYQQMTELEKKYQGPYMLTEAPKENGAHDDFPDSSALACILSKDFSLPEVEILDNFLLRR